MNVHGQDEYPVDVKAVFHTDNTIKPISLLWRNREIDFTTLDVQKGVSLKTIGTGIRYKIFARGRESYLYRFADLWYMAFQKEDMHIPELHRRHWVENESFKRIIDEQYDNPHKASVEVIALFTHEEGVTPLAFMWDDGRKYLIDRYCELGRKADVTAGISGICYEITVLGRKARIYRDDDTWYMHRKGKGILLDVHGRSMKE